MKPIKVRIALRYERTEQNGPTFEAQVTEWGDAWKGNAQSDPSRWQFMTRYGITGESREAAIKNLTRTLRAHGVSGGRLLVDRHLYHSINPGVRVDEEGYAIARLDRRGWRKCEPPTPLEVRVEEQRDGYRASVVNHRQVSAAVERSSGRPGDWYEGKHYRATGPAPNHAVNALRSHIRGMGVQTRVRVVAEA